MCAYFLFYLNESINCIINTECLTTPKHKNKSAIGYQTYGIFIKSKKSNMYK